MIGRLPLPGLRSIRGRLLASLLAVLVVGVALLGATTYRSVRAESEAVFDFQLRQMALTLRDQGSISAGDAAALADESLDIVVRIWGPDGQSIYSSQPGLELPPQVVLGYSDVDLAGARWRVFGTQAHNRVIQVAQPLRVRRDLAGRAAFNSVVPLLLLTPLLVAAVWWQVGVSLASLGGLAGDVRARDDGALDPLPARELPTEIAPLAAALNGLLGRLRVAMDAQRAFVADAAHELRSPLTALKLQLQLLQRAGDAASRAEATAALAGGIERAIRLVDQLLALARAEPGSATTAAEPVDLVRVAQAALADVVALAASRQVDLELDPASDDASPVVVRGNAALLQLMVRNLADNAVRYVPRGGRVRVRVQVVEGAAGARVVVDDDGPGIPEAERNRVFDRFYRGEHAQDAEATHGSGLGLAIVQRIAQGHRASVSLGASPLGGLRAEVAFPAGGTAVVETPVANSRVAG